MENDNDDNEIAYAWDHRRNTILNNLNYDDTLEYLKIQIADKNILTTSALLSDGDDFAMSIICLDWYQNANEESVIRVFGRTKDNASVCLHVYGYRPYFFICPQEASSQYLKKLEQAICTEKNLQRSLYRISLCKAKDIYGYKDDFTVFAKIELKNPLGLKQMAAFLYKGQNQLKHQFQPYDVHIPYILQFLSDYGLCGMGQLRLKRVGAVTWHCNHYVNELVTHASQIIVDTGSSHKNKKDPWVVNIPSLTKWQKETLGLSTDGYVKLEDGVSPPNFSNSYASCRSVFSSVDTLLDDQLCKWFEDAKDGITSQEAVDILEDLQTSTAMAEANAQPLVYDSDSDNELMFEDVDDPVLDFSQKTLIVPPSLDNNENPGEEILGIKRVHENIIELDIDEADQTSNSHPNYIIHKKPSFHRSESGHTGYLPPSSYGLIRPREKPPTIEQVLDDCQEHQLNDNREKILSKDVGTSLRPQQARPAIPTFRILFVEIFAASRTGLLSNPDYDRILCIACSVFEDKQMVGDCHYCLAPLEDENNRDCDMIQKEIEDEVYVLEDFLDHVTRCDPDAIAGWEVQNYSLGYILKRAKLLQLPNFVQRLSRVPRWGQEDHRHMNDAYGRSQYSDIWISGRLTLNLWRLLRGQVDLSSYSLENVSQVLFSESLPYLHHNKLLQLFEKENSRSHVLDYIARRTMLCNKVILHFDVITKLTEFSQLLGIDLFSTMTRGSQFQVEGVMLQVAKPENYVFPSCTPEQLQSQPGLMYIATNLEPKSAMHSDPVAVFDFRSLYPSLIVSYNLCFSTFIGKVSNKGLSYEAGVFRHFPLDRPRHYLSPERIEELYDTKEMFICDNGCMYVKPSTKVGVLPKMIKAILETRFAVKKDLAVASKNHWNEWKRVLDARQYALKMLANVTYGYTSASFSGRMPMSGLADSIVLLGRQVLARVMEMAESKDEANAPWVSHVPTPLQVLYGDTDSMFLHMPNCSRDVAFAIAREIADTATKQLPYPMKLQFEKLYHPCILVTKKRYCGNKLEAPDDAGLLESKGLENIRRDSCPIMQEIMTNMLLLLFETKDLDALKSMFLRYVQDIENRMIGVDKFIFSSKVRVPLSEKYRGPQLPPAAQVASANSKNDPMMMPHHKQRVQFVISSANNLETKLYELVRSPSPNISINAEYYIQKKIIPSLHRLFGLPGVSVSVEEWYLHRKRSIARPLDKCLPGNITSYFRSNACKICNLVTSNDNNICDLCNRDPQTVAYHLEMIQKREFEARLDKAYECRTCSMYFLGTTSDIGDMCTNTHCHKYYARDW